MHWQYHCHHSGHEEKYDAEDAQLTQTLASHSQGWHNRHHLAVFGPKVFNLAATSFNMSQVKNTAEIISSDSAN